MVVSDAWGAVYLGSDAVIWFDLVMRNMTFWWIWMVVFVLCLPAGFCLSILLFWGCYNMLSGFVIGFVLCLRVLGFRFRLGLAVGLCSLDFACFLLCGLLVF